MTIRHDPRVRFFLGDQWTDVTDYVRSEGAVQIEYGRPDDSTETPPCTASFDLENETSAWSPSNPMGPFYDALSGNVPTEVVLRLAHDTYAGTAVNAWAPADTGQAWTLSGGSSDFDQSPGVGTVNIPAATDIRIAYLPDVHLANADVSLDFSLPVTNITGGPALPAGPIVRGLSTTDFVYARLEVQTDETFTIGIRHATGTVLAAQVVVAGLVHTAAAGLSIRCQADDQTIRAKVWHTADGEPLAWNVTAQYQAKVAGFVGIRTALGTGSTNGPMLVSYTRFSAGSPRYFGEATDFQPNANKANTDRWTSVTAYGLLHRLGQGKAPIRSSLRVGLPSIGTPLRAYWPCEDGENAASIASAIGGPAMGFVGAPDFGANSDFASSLPIPNLALSGWFGDVPFYVHNGEAQLRFLVSIPDAGTTDDTILARLGVAGTATLWEVVYYAGSGGQLAVKAYDPGGVLLMTGGPAAFSVDGNPTRLSLELKNNGSAVDWSLSALRLDFGAGGISGSLASRQIAQVAQVQAGPQGILDDVAIGHITLESTITNLYANVSELVAWRTERARDRIIRLGNENGIPIEGIRSASGDTVPMGQQQPVPVLDSIRECAFTDGGTLYEPRGALALGYRSRASVYNTTATVAADLAAGDMAHPFAPLADDKAARNDVTVEQLHGSTARAVLESGPKSVQPYPNGIGTYDTQVKVNLADEFPGLADQATWRLALGTVVAPRFRNMAFDLDGAPALQPSVLDLGVDDRVTVVNVASVDLYHPVDVLARGYSEFLGNHRHTIKINATPADGYQVVELDAAVASVRWDSGTSSLTAGVTSSATSISVTVTDPFDLWTTSAGDFPLEVEVGGEVWTVTNITGAASPQTFTVTRGTNGVTKAHDAGAPVHVAHPARLAL